ncbi:unnamed protein product, partial [Pylaiella littoralis]
KRNTEGSKETLFPTQKPEADAFVFYRVWSASWCAWASVRTNYEHVFTFLKLPFTAVQQVLHGILLFQQSTHSLLRTDTVLCCRSPLSYPSEYCTYALRRWVHSLTTIANPLPVPHKSPDVLSIYRRL